MSTQTIPTDLSARDEHQAVRSSRTDAALLVLRLTLGVVMIAHGWQKLTEGGFAGTGQGFAEMGAPGAPLTGYLVLLLELGGGVLMLLGVGTALIGLLFTLTMVGAIAMVHGASGFYAANGGYEFPLVLGVIGIVLALAGPGRFSVDSVLLPRLRRSKS